MLGSKRIIALAATTHSDFLGKLVSTFRTENSGAWLRFLIATVGLTIAFAAAIFSTAARDAGNLIATVILASLALLTAVAVGLGTVPYLARRVGAKRGRGALRFGVNRAGKVFLFVVFLV